MAQQLSPGSAKKEKSHLPGAAGGFQGFGDGGRGGMGKGGKGPGRSSLETNKRGNSGFRCRPDSLPVFG
jgi:hypothetical protein